MTPPSTPDPRTPGGSPHPERDYEGDIGAAHWQADQNRKKAHRDRDAAVAQAEAALTERLAEIDRIEKAQIASAKCRHGKEGQ